MIAPLLLPVGDIASALTSQGLAVNIDDSSASIGKRYARSDEVGIPYAVTVDHDTIAAVASGTASVTVRERDSCAQIRVPVSAVAEVLRSLVEGRSTWAELVAGGKYTLVTSGEDKAATAASARLA